MNKFLNFGKSLWQDDSGATAIEYGLLAALISVAIIVTVTSLGGTLNSVFSTVDTDLTAAMRLRLPNRAGDRGRPSSETLIACVFSWSSLRR